MNPDIVYSNISNRVYFVDSGDPDIKKELLDKTPLAYEDIGTRNYSPSFVGPILKALGFAVIVKDQEGKAFYLNKKDFAQFLVNYNHLTHENPTQPHALNRQTLDDITGIYARYISNPQLNKKNAEEMKAMMSRINESKLPRTISDWLQDFPK